MPYHWQSQNVKHSGVDDMVLLQKITEQAIMENLKKRFLDNCIYTYIGPVLIALNPFKQLPIYTSKEIDMYQGANAYENPPHIYALVDDMYRNMLIDMENHCVIISGESGAGKTVSAKLMMEYIAKVSSGAGRVEEVKRAIMESNPLLEAFGNAKTIRNNNSSRFGKYVEIQFSRGGEPIGGKISQFLLEKSRVVSQNRDERNFHIFYQLCVGAPADMKKRLGMTEPKDFYFTNQSGCFTADGINDMKEYSDTMRAMACMGIADVDQMNILSIVAGVMHLGNVPFQQEGNYAQVQNRQYISFPAYLLGISEEYLNTKLTSRVMESKWGRQAETIQMNLTVEQAQGTRDALCKALYHRMFDYIVEAINRAIKISSDEINIGLLDIYGFEIFDQNGFEQFCINFVNEKLQQIFIELTLRAEQEEYVQEGIQWTPVNYFNNKVVCDMIESKAPNPGVFCILDDVCAISSAVTDGIDENFAKDLNNKLSGNKYFQGGGNSRFIVHHYAGQVTYTVSGFCERNRDILNNDLIQMMQSSTNPFIQALFPEQVSTASAKRPTTAGNKIRSQANLLVDRLMRCIPHYIRCVKPNDTKRPGDWEDARVLHQVEYLGLKENIRVRRAGFAYRRPFDKFLRRYAILTKETWPQWRGDVHKGIEHLMTAVSMDRDQWQCGKTKLFIKKPESLFLLEECRERKFDLYARVIQKAFRKQHAHKFLLRMKQQASDLLVNRKERNRLSLNRSFNADYIGLDNRPELKCLVPKREKIAFAAVVNKYDRRFKYVSRDLILTNKQILLIGREKVRKGPKKGTIEEVIKRSLPLESVDRCFLSSLKDDFIVLYVAGDYDSLIETVLKTEFLMALNRNRTESGLQKLTIEFGLQCDFKLKKEGWGGGGTRQLRFQNLRLNTQQSANAPVQLKSSGKVLTISVPPGLPSDSRPSINRTWDPAEMQQIRKVLAERLARKGIHYDPNRRQAPQQRQQQHQQPRGQQNRQQPRHFNAPSDPQFPPPPAEAYQPPVATHQYKQQQLQPQQAAPRPHKPPRPRPKTPRPQARAMWGYEAQDTDELSFNEGDIIEIIREDPSGWFTGRIYGREGLFPANYVEKI